MGTCGKPPSGENPVSEPSAGAGLDAAAPLADRYYRLAETMNARGAIELAVPFYRQALALLLEERNQLRQLLPEHERLALQSPLEDDLAGLLQAADLLRGERPDLDSCIAELSQDLTPASARQVIAGLDEVLLRSPDQRMPAEGHSLRGKAFLLLGEVEEALICFDAAHQADPAVPKHAINFAGSLVSQSRSQEALPILRSLYASGIDALDPAERQALLRNLATAENQQGHRLEALQLRHQWLLSQADALPPEGWFEFCAEALGQSAGQELTSAAVDFLKDLHKIWPQFRAATEVLAQVLERLGDYRQAALLYRDLLRS